MDRDVIWCQVTVTGPDGRVHAQWQIRGHGSPGLEVVDHLAHLTVLARRAGLTLRLRDIAAELDALLQLTGLAECLTT